MVDTAKASQQPSLLLLHWAETVTLPSSPLANGQSHVLSYDGRSEL